MSIFKKAVFELAFAKVGILGFQGSGKTFTGAEMSIGIYKLAVEKKQIKPGTPVLFYDTETGSDWIIDKFEREKIPLEVAKTRSFDDLIAAVKEAAAANTVLHIDSITHPWRELVETYTRVNQRKRGLTIQDWMKLKSGQYWGKFSELFVTADCHIVMCGRAGDIFEQEIRDDGKKEFVKVGTKMKTETETGFEPSLLIEMEKERDLETGKMLHVAYVMKDRNRTLDGARIVDPTFKDWLPHISKLTFGAKHHGFDADRTSADSIEVTNQYDRVKRQKEIVLDEIKEILVKHYPSTSGADKAKKISLLHEIFGTPGWERVTEMDLDRLQRGYEALQAQLEPVREKPRTASQPTLAADSIPENFAPATVGETKTVPTNSQEVALHNGNPKNPVVEDKDAFLEPEERDDFVPNSVSDSKIAAMAGDITLSQGKSFTGKPISALNLPQLKAYINKYGPNREDTIPPGELGACMTYCKYLESQFAAEQQAAQFGAETA